MHEVWKSTKGATENQTSSPTGVYVGRNVPLTHEMAPLLSIGNAYSMLVEHEQFDADVHIFSSNFNDHNFISQVTFN